MVSAAFQTLMDQKRGADTRSKVEHITKAGVTTDISSYFLSGGNIQQVKERAPDQIQAGEFDIQLANHDDKFSEFIVGSLFETQDYHGDRIRISQGFLLPNGTEEYEVQAVGYIDQLTIGPEGSTVVLRCRDILWRLMDQKLHARPVEEIPVANSGNTGDGFVTAVETKPFATVNQDWTLTCTLGGGDATATFSVVGSVAGNIGTATSGTEFSDGAANRGIKFTVKAGGTNWVSGDVFTFSTKQYPQWSSVNAGKIIWSILTGYVWDSDTQENFSGLVLDFDRTQSSANTELDYDSFVSLISALDDSGNFNLKGFVPYDTNTVDFLQDIILLFLGSIFAGNDGRIKAKTFIPIFDAATPINFSDDKKLTMLGYIRTIDEVINSVSVVYRKSDVYVFSDEQDTRDGFYAKRDSSSISAYKEIGIEFNVPWHTASGSHVTDFADKLVGKYGTPPLNIEFKTGMDALTTEIGDNITVTGSKIGLSEIGAEVAAVSKSFDVKPSSVSIRARRDEQADAIFGFIGSEIDEGDGISPQSDDYDTATESDKKFIYFGSVATSIPDHRMF